MSHSPILSATAKALLLLLLLGSHMAGAQVPAVVMSNHQTLYSSLTNGVSRVSANARGDVFFADPGGKRVLELPAGTTTPVVLLVNITVGSSGSAPNSVNVDSAGNVYVANAYAGRVIRVPFVSGSYPTGIDATTLTATVCSAGMTVDCTLPTLGALVGYYSQTSDIAMNAAGDFYFVDINDSVSSGKYNRIVELTASGTVKILVDNLTTAINAQIASDTAGDLFYANGTSLFSIPVGATTATAVNTSTLSKPSGVTFDRAGNLIVTDSGNSRIVAIPLENGALNFSDQYVVTPQYSQNSVGIDSFGTIYYTGSSGGSTAINASQTSVYSAGSLAVGSNSSSFLVSAAFNTSTTLSQLYTHSNGATVTASVSTCVLGTTYAAGKSCSINMQIKPTRVGPVSGLLGVANSSGSVLAQFTFTATGLGSAVALDPGTAGAVGSGFASPAGVAVDRAGNVFVADTSADAVYELIGGTGTPVAIGTGLNGPTGVAVNAAGDLFISDAGNSRIVQIPNLGTTLATGSQMTIASNLTAPLAIASGPLDALYVAQAGELAIYSVRGILPATLTSVLSTSFAKPGALAVDPSGNVFVADAATGEVSEIAAYSNTVTVIASGLTVPSGLATDSAGDLFLADNGTAQVVRIPNENGTLKYADAVSVGSFASPLGLATDSSANLYVTDPSMPAVYEVGRTAGLLNFGNISFASTSPVLSATLVSSGNQPLTLGTPLYTASGDTADFEINSSGTCAAGQVLASATGCTLAATFSPSAKGSVSQVLAIKASPTVTTSPLQLTLTGNGTYLAPTSLAVALTSPAGTLSYGETATFTATLTPSSFNSASPTGKVTFVINDIAQKPVSVAADGTASIPTSALSGGSNTVYASYSGDINYAPSTSTVLTLTVSTATTSTNLTLSTSYTNPTSSLTGSSMTFTALITPSAAGFLSGTVSFVSGTTTLGTATLTATTSGAYQAVFTSSTVPAGTYSVTAVYPGDTNYNGSISAAQTLIVSTAGIQMTASSTSLTSTPTAPGQITLSVASIAGLTAPVTFSCSGLPAYTVCRFSPAYISLTSSTLGIPGAPTAVGLAIQVNVNPGQPVPVVSQLSKRSGIALAVVFGAPLLLNLRRRKLLRGWMALSCFCILLLPMCLAVSGCGAASTTDHTPVGTSTVTVTATSSTATTSLTLNLTVAN